MHNKLITLCLVFPMLTAIAQFSSGDVLTNAASIVHIDEAFILTLALDRSPPPPNTSSGFFDVSQLGPDVAEVVFLSSDTSQGGDWYIAEEGVVFSQAAIDNNRFPRLDIAEGFEIAIGESQHLALNTGRDFDLNGNPDRDMFGWVEVRVEPDLSLGVVDSGVSMSRGVGIVVGEHRIAPEPQSCHILCLGALSVAARLRKRRQ